MCSIEERAVTRGIVMSVYAACQLHGLVPVKGFSEIARMAPIAIDLETRMEHWHGSAAHSNVYAAVLRRFNLRPLFQFHENDEGLAGRSVPVKRYIDPLAVVRDLHF